MGARGDDSSVTSTGDGLEDSDDCGKRCEEVDGSTPHSHRDRDTGDVGGSGGDGSGGSGGGSGGGGGGGGGGGDGVNDRADDAVDELGGVEQSPSFGATSGETVPATAENGECGTAGAYVDEASIEG